MTTQSRTPLQLIKLILLGILLINGAWGLDFLPFRQPDLHSGVFTSLRTSSPAMLEVGVFVAGVLLIWLAGKRLSKGIRLEAWSEDDLAIARRWSDSSLLNWLTWMLLTGSMAVIVLGHFLHFRWSPVVLIYSTYPLNWLKANMRKPQARPEREDWHQRPRFFSSHWGEPPTDRSGSASS